MAKYIPLKAIKDMKDFLQRSDRITKFNKPWTEKMKEYRKGQYSILDWLLDDLDETIVEIEDRPKGKWLRKEYYFDEWVDECSVCGEAYIMIDGTATENGYNYCPNCGASMGEDIRGEEQ